MVGYQIQREATEEGLRCQTWAAEFACTANLLRARFWNNTQNISQHNEAGHSILLACNFTTIEVVLFQRAFFELFRATAGHSLCA